MVLKAYNGRCVQSWLTDCLVDALEIHPEHEILVLTSSCMSALAKFFSLMEAHGRYLPQPIATALHDTGFRFLKVFMVLCREHVRMRMNRWQMTPKFHVFAHLCINAARNRRNPRFEHTFIDEDGMRWVKCMCAKAHPLTRHNWLLKCGKLRLFTMKYRASRRKTRMEKR